jgi:hypothetical protein
MEAASILIVLAALGVNVSGPPVDSTRELAAVHHTVYFAGQSGWAPDRYETSSEPAPPTYDRYPAAPVHTASNVAPPPSISDRARSAFTETGTTLREGVEAGIEAANQQFRRGGEELSEQLQGWSDNVGRELQSTGNNLRTSAEQAVGGGSNRQFSNPFAPTTAPAASAKTRTGVAPPPWDNNSSSAAPDWPAEPEDASSAIDQRALIEVLPARTESGWTIMGSTVVPPALVVPQLVNSPQNAATQQSSADDGWPEFPALPSAREPAVTVRAAQASQTTAATAETDSWAVGWGADSGTQQATIGRSGLQPATIERSGTQPATIGRSDTRASEGSTGLNRGSVAAQAPAASPQDSQPKAERKNDDPWADYDPWPQTTSTTSAGSPAQQQTGTTASPQATSSANNQPPIGVAIGDAGLTVPKSALPNSTGQAPTLPNSVGKAPATEEPPWMPLIVVSLSLAGSLGANLFLGWSYMDARLKYLSLVSKTADKFRRTSKAAA